MNNRYTGLRYSLLVAGVFVMMIGIGHAFMPILGYEDHIHQRMPVEVSDHFYYLGTYAICTFLLTLGFISIYASQLHYPRFSFILSLTFSLLWILRAIFEVVYPVKLKIFFLENPTVVLLPFISIIVLVYSAGSVSYLVSKKK